MAKGSLPVSALQGDMVRLPAPCGQHAIFYPAQLAVVALMEKRYHVFHTVCECGTAHLVALQEDGAHFRMGGPPEAIIEEYERIPWPEKVTVDGNGVFHAKEAPSLGGMLAYLLDRTRDRRRDKLGGS